MSFHNSTNSIISNCSFVGNRAVYGGGIHFSNFSSSASISNCVLWNNTPSEFYFDEYSPTITYSLIQGGYPGIGNIDVDPLFIGGDPFDYHLSPNSPCIDAGTDNGAPATDLNGNPRLQGGAVDIGAYEYDGWPLVTRTYVRMPSHNIVPGDFVRCLVTVWNSHEFTLEHQNLFVILDVFGQMFMAPSFTDLDSYQWSFEPGRTDLIVLPEFIWPDNVGSATGIVWYAALVNSEMTELASEIGVFDFGWSE